VGSDRGGRVTVAMGMAGLWGGRDLPGVEETCQVDLARAKPAELPVEQPTRFELIIHLNTAKALGLTLPQLLLLRAGEVIE